MPADYSAHNAREGDDKNKQPIKIGLGAKYRRVDVHGVPIPEASPTGETENDKYPNMAHIDMFNLAPTFAPTDIKVPVEGGELSLEFRRTLGIRNRSTSHIPAKRPITWASDHVLGLGWDTNLGSRIIITDPSQPTEPPTVRVVDEIGNTFQYQEIGGEFKPDTFHSFSNDAVKARLIRVGSDAIVFKKTFGTVLTYTRVRSKSNLNHSVTETYYRLEKVVDRNGNTLIYSYSNSGSIQRDEDILVRRIHEQAHPERSISFEYADMGPDPNTGDYGYRLIAANGPMGRVYKYSYASIGQPKTGHQLLKMVTLPEVEDPQGPRGTLISPTVSFDYFVDAIISQDDHEIAVYYAAPAMIRDARGHATRFTYVMEQFPVSIGTGGIKHESTPRVATTTTVDGTATFDTLNRTDVHVHTTVVDTRNTLVGYEFFGTMVVANNQVGLAIYFVKLIRTTTGAGAATFEWAPDPNGNLIQVTDLSGNVITFGYGTPGLGGDPYDQPVDPSSAYDPVGNPNHYQVFNRPSARVIDPGGLNLVTRFYYETVFNKERELIDPEGIKTAYILSGGGNRHLIQEPLGKTTEMNYEPDGFMREMIDPDGRITVFEKTFNPSDLHAYLTIKKTLVGYRNGPPLNLSAVTVSDIMGNTRKLIDANGNETINEYDNLNRLTKIIKPPVEDPNNPSGPPVSSFEEKYYDFNGNLVLAIDDDGDAIVYEYDLMNRETLKRVRMTNPMANEDVNDLITRTTYDPVGLKQTVTDPMGNTTTYYYDSILRLIKEITPPVTLPNGSRVNYETRYEYGANSGSGAFTYWTGWNPTRVINRRNFATDHIYDTAYRKIMMVRRSDDGASIAHDHPARPGEPATEYVYNRASKNIAQMVFNESFVGQPEHQASYTFYDELYRTTITVRDMDGDGPGLPLGTFINDAATFVGDVDDLTTKTAYDLFGNVLSTTDPEGNTTLNEYDGIGRLIKTKQSGISVFDPANYNSSGYLSPMATVTYDAQGNRIVVEDANHVKTRMFYDARNRLKRTILDLNGDGTFDPTSNGPDIVTENHYNLSGQIIKTVDSRGNEVKTEYDRAGRTIRVIQPPVADAEHGGQIVQPEIRTVYDKNSNIIQVIDPRQVIAESRYDELNRIRFQTVAANTTSAVTSESQYDPNGNIVFHVLHNGSNKQITEGVYDAFDRKNREIHPFVPDLRQRIKVMDYYLNGNLKVIKDPEGQAIEHYYDRDNRLVKQRFKNAPNPAIMTPFRTPLFPFIRFLSPFWLRIPFVSPFAPSLSLFFQGESRSFSYNKTGKMLTATDKNGTSRYEYDALYHIIREHRLVIGRGSYTVESFYDAAGNRTKCVYPQTNRTLVNIFDRKNRVVEIRDQGNKTTKYTYYANGNRATMETPNGVIARFDYDALNRVLKIDCRKGNVVVYAAQYAYDKVGNRLKIDEQISNAATRNLSYRYDDQYRLTGESWANNAYTYAYDPAGNRLRLEKTAGAVTEVTTYVYDNLNRLLASKTGNSATRYQYDLNGNRTSKRVDNGPYTRYYWDIADRLMAVDIDGRQPSEFQAAYDYRSRRVKVFDNGETTYFRYDGGNCFQEFKNNSLQVEFIRGNGLGGGIGSILYADKSHSGGLEETFTFNPVGHSVALTDPSGSLLATYAYEAFGAVVQTTGNSKNNRLAYTKERHISIGLDNHGMRYYDPGAGCYISRDPAGYKDGLNPYHHVKNNPINHFDPLGLWGEWLQGALDVVSVIPVVGTAASLVNAGISVANGNYGEAALNLAGAIPGVGSVVKGASLGAKAVKAAVKVANAVNKVADVVEKVETTIEVVEQVREGNLEGALETAVDAAANGIKPGRGHGPSKNLGAKHGGGHRNTPKPEGNDRLDKLKANSKKVKEANTAVDRGDTVLVDPKDPKYRQKLNEKVPMPQDGKKYDADHIPPKGAAEEAEAPFVGERWKESGENRSLGAKEDKNAKRDIQRLKKEGASKEEIQQRAVESMDPHLPQP